MEHRDGVVGAEGRRNGRLHDQHAGAELARHAHHRRAFGYRPAAVARHQSRIAEHWRGTPMRSLLIVGASGLVVGGVASAQTTDRGYVEGVAQSAFGNVTSQSYGVEFGA